MVDTKKLELLVDILEGFSVSGRGYTGGRLVTHTFSFCLELVGTFTDMMEYVSKTNDEGIDEIARVLCMN